LLLLPAVIATDTQAADDSTLQLPTKQKSIKTMPPASQLHVTAEPTNEIELVA